MLREDFILIDGTIILTVEDLIDWATKYYKNRFALQNQQNVLFLELI